jgi:hypothetical protein
VPDSVSMMLIGKNAGFFEGVKIWRFMFQAWQYVNGYGIQYWAAHTNLSTAIGYYWTCCEKILEYQGRFPSFLTFMVRVTFAKSPPNSKI